MSQGTTRPGYFYGSNWTVAPAGETDLTTDEQDDSRGFALFLISLCRYNPPSVDQEKDDATPDNCKILFRFYSDVLEKWTVETLWATVVDEKKGWYRLDNIPFYAMFIACDDIVFAEFDADEQFLTFRKLITPSGNSTVQVVIMNPSIETNSIRDQFNALGCSSEKFKEGYFVVDVPAQLSYAPVITLLDDLFEKGTIDYAEACLSEKHQAETAD